MSDYVAAINDLAIRHAQLSQAIEPIQKSHLENGVVRRLVKNIQSEMGHLRSRMRAAGEDLPE